MSTSADSTRAGVTVAVRESGEPSGPPRPEPDKPKRGRGWRWTPYLFLLPALALELFVHFGPMVAGVVMSSLKLTQYQLARWWEAPWAGLANYRVILDLDQPVGASLFGSFLVTAAFTLIVVTTSWCLGLAGAISLQRVRRGRGTLRTLFLIPYALPVFAAVITWRFLLQRDNGMVNHVLVDQLGLLGENAFWLIGPNSFWSVCVVTVWREWPFAFLMIMAALQSIPDDVYEASALDGAGPWRQLRGITLPMISPVNQVLVLVLALRTFRDFETPYVLFGGSPPQQARLISVEIYQNSFVTFNFGLGAAMSVLLLLFLMAMTSVYLIATRRKGS
jgi:multiple sugar transport system permease protein